MKNYLWKLRHAAEEEYWKQVLGLLERDDGASYLDCGCSDGARSLEMARRIGTVLVSGVEVAEEKAAEAEARGLAVTRGDLNLGIPRPDGSADAVTALEVIEHLHAPDTFLKGLSRVLRSGGYAVLSTENLASWHNIFALLWGWQPFSLSQFSETKAALGNPFGLDRGEDWNPALTHPSYRHCIVMSHRGVKELLEAHGFVVEKLLGAGYYPLPSFLAKPMARCDARHAAFLVIKIRKTE